MASLTLLLALQASAQTTGLAERRPAPRMMRLRGGGLPAAAMTALASPAARSSIPALAGVGGLVIVPLTLYRQAYAFSVGYGLSVAAMGAALLAAFKPASSSLVALHTGCLAVYGVRLGLHLLVREQTVPEKAAQLKAMDRTPRLKRVPFAASVSLLYAMMASPALFALQNPAAVAGSAVAAAGVALQWGGCALEAVADTQKLLAKRGAAPGAAWRGPSGGAYAFSRHPNYLGEVLFWTGTFVGGAPAFGARPAPWIAGGLGLASILSIMLGATKRLEAKQKEKYGGDKAYEAWVARTAPLLGPF